MSSIAILASNKVFTEVALLIDSFDNPGFLPPFLPLAFAASRPAKVLSLIGEGHIIKIFSPEYFLATKLEAFKSRGNNDGRTSSDFEDIIYLLNNRFNIWEELDHAEKSLNVYLIDTLRELRANKYIEEWISCHLSHYEQGRQNFILGAIEKFIGLPPSLPQL